MSPESSSVCSGRPRNRRSPSSRKRLAWYKQQPLEKVGVYRLALARSVGRPTVVRRLLWWSTLNFSGFKRAKRFGTFGLTSYGALGAESLHPISPLTTTLTFGPISPTGDVNVKLIYDHRVLDGAYIARRLLDIEATLNGAILEELSGDVEERPEASATPAPAEHGRRRFATARTPTPTHPRRCVPIRSLHAEVVRPGELSGGEWGVRRSLRPGTSSIGGEIRS